MSYRITVERPWSVPCGLILSFAQRANKTSSYSYRTSVSEQFWLWIGIPRLRVTVNRLISPVTTMHGRVVHQELFGWSPQQPQYHQLYTSQSFLVGWYSLLCDFFNSNQNFLIQYCQLIANVSSTMLYIVFFFIK